MSVLGKVIADFTKALHDDLFTPNSMTTVIPVYETIVVQELSKYKEAPKTSSLALATDSSLGNELTCGGSLVVNIGFSV